jgi:alpha-1,2-mannosyltransferase
MHFMVCRFDMSISSEKLRFVYLHQRKYVEAAMYPYFTMLGQSLGSLILGQLTFGVIRTV